MGQYLNDHSIRRAIMSVAPHMPRHYLVMEVKENLICADRSNNLKRFNMPHFKKIAHVVMGEPKADYKARVHSKLLEIKQAQANEDWKKKKAALERKKVEKERRKAAAERQKKLAEEARKKKEEAEAAAAKRKAELEAKKKEEEDAKKKEEGADGEKKDEN